MTNTEQTKLAEYDEWSPPAPKKRGRPRKVIDPLAPKAKYVRKKKPKKVAVIETPDDHAQYVLNQERQKHAPLTTGKKPRKIVKHDLRVSRYLIGDMLIDRLAAGELLKEILQTPGMPTFTQVQRWRRDNLYDFEDRYQWALRSQSEAMADDVIILADGDKDPRDKRIMFDARRFLMAHRRPEVWGERMTLAGDKQNPLFQSNVRVELATLSDSELAALEAFALARKDAIEKPQQAAMDVPFTDVTERDE